MVIVDSKGRKILIELVSTVVGLNLLMEHYEISAFHEVCSSKFGLKHAKNLFLTLFTSQPDKGQSIFSVKKV